MAGKGEFRQRTFQVACLTWLVKCPRFHLAGTGLNAETHHQNVILQNGTTGKGNSWAAFGVEVDGQVEVIELPVESSSSRPEAYN